MFKSSNMRVLTLAGLHRQRPGPQGPEGPGQTERRTSLWDVSWTGSLGGTARALAVTAICSVKGRATAHSNITTHAAGAVCHFAALQPRPKLRKVPVFGCTAASVWVHTPPTHGWPPGVPVTGPVGPHRRCGGCSAHICDSARSCLLYLDGIQTAWLALRGRQPAHTPVVPAGVVGLASTPCCHDHWSGPCLRPCLKLEECRHAYAPARHRSAACHTSHVTASHTTSSLAACVDCTTQGPCHTHVSHHLLLMPTWTDETHRDSGPATDSPLLLLITAQLQAGAQTANPSCGGMPQKPAS